jgi:hypothetical protein
MLNRTILPTALGVGASGQATIDMILGQKLYAVTLEIGADGTSSGVPIIGAIAASGITQAQIETALDAMIGGLSVKWNSTEQWQRTLASRINQLNGLNGSRYLAITSGTPGTAGFRIYLTLFFAEFWRKNPAEVPALAWNLNKKGGAAYTDGKSYGDTSSCQINVWFNAGLNGLSLTGYYLWEPADLSRGIGSIKKLITDDLQAVGSKNDFKLDMTQLIQAIHLWPTGDVAPRYVSTFRLNASGLDVQDRLSYLENQSYMYFLELFPDTSAAPRFDWIADVDDPILNALPASAQSSLRMYLEYSGAAGANMPMIIERIGAPA